LSNRNRQTDGRNRVTTPDPEVIRPTAVAFLFSKYTVEHQIADISALPIPNPAMNNYS